MTGVCKGPLRNWCMGLSAKQHTGACANHRTRPLPAPAWPGAPVTLGERQDGGVWAERGREPLDPRSQPWPPLIFGVVRKALGCFRFRAVALGSFRPRSAPVAPPIKAGSRHCQIRLAVGRDASRPFLAPEVGNGRGFRRRVGWAASPLAGGMTPSSRRAACPRAQRLRFALSLARSVRPAPRISSDWLEAGEGGARLTFPLSLADSSGRAGARRRPRATIGFLAVGCVSIGWRGLRAPAGPRPPPPLPGASRRPEVRGGPAGTAGECGAPRGPAGRDGAGARGGAGGRVVGGGGRSRGARLGGREGPCEGLGGSGAL